MGAPGEDRISGLPDELLRCILVRLGSARAAVRTGVLSRRWRHILGPLPELVLYGRLPKLFPDGPLPELVLDGDLDASPPLESSLDNIDAALAACEAPIVKRLDIGFALWCAAGGRGIPAVRAARWLTFASERVVDELYVYLPGPEVADGEEEEAVQELPVPACESVRAIQLVLGSTWRIQLPPAGIFRELTDLTMNCVSMDGGEITALVCTQCPCLVNLKLCLMELVNSLDVSIRSDSLQSLEFTVNEIRRLEIVAPRLEKLSLWCADIDEARFDGVGRRLRMLEASHMSLVHQFEEVDELSLFICIGRGKEEYKRFLNETKSMPKCKILNVSLVWNHHGLVPGMLHLLRSCNSTRKVSLSDGSDSEYQLRHPCRPSCPCRFEKSQRIDDISLNSLEEVEITSDTSSHEVLEFVEQLCSCNAAQLKKVVLRHRMKMINPAPPTKEAREKICSMCQPNIEVEFYVFSDWDWVRLD